MNYFLKKHHIRLMSLALCICMVASMLVGCGAKTPTETTPPTENNVPPGLVEVKPTEETEPPTEATEPASTNMAVVKGTDDVPVKSSPSLTAKTIGHLSPNTKVEVIKTMTYMGVEWALIREGWVMLSNLELSDGFQTENDDEDSTAGNQSDATQPGTATNITATVTSNGLNIRKEPNIASTVVGNYKTGQTITILETKNGWGRTDKGWVSMNYVSTNGTNNNANTNTNNNNNTNNNTAADGNTYFVTAGTLNIRDEASTAGKQVGTYGMGQRVVVTQTSNGWGKTDKGWISMEYVYKTGDTGKNTAKGIIIGDGLNIRTGPSTEYDSVGNMGYGNRVHILEQITVGGATWGCTSKGWISMKYVYIDGTEGEHSGTGTITGDVVNIRSGPGTGYDSVGSLKAGDTVEILEQFEYNGVYWGCTSKGWICMDYVKMD